MGDTLQFVRYAALVKKQGGMVVLACPAPLMPLLRTCPGIDRLVSRKSAIPLHTVHIPLLSLPRVLRTELATIPCDVPYLYADPARVHFWRNELANVSAFKVGIAWQGNPKHVNDANRSVPLSQFQPLAEIPGVQLFSLQVGKGSEQLAQLDGKFTVMDLRQRIEGAYTETAAVMKNLDLVICCDTSVAHLAGALGVPVWVALPFATDWRWLHHRDDSPWYPTMRLFRQQRAKDWPDVFTRLKEALASEIQKPRNRALVGVPDEARYAYAEKAESETMLSPSSAAYVPAPLAQRKLTMTFPAPAAVADLAADLPGPKAFASPQLRRRPSSNCAMRTTRRMPRPGTTGISPARTESSRAMPPIAFVGSLACVPIMPTGTPVWASSFAEWASVSRARLVCVKPFACNPTCPKPTTTWESYWLRWASAPRPWPAGRKPFGSIPITPKVISMSPSPWPRINNMKRRRIITNALCSFVPTMPKLIAIWGCCAVEQGRPAEGIILLQHALRLKPDFVDAYNNLGLAYADLGRTEEALLCYNDALPAPPPKYAEVYNNYGTALAAKCRSDEALACFAQALRLRPNYPEAHWHQALTWLHQGDLARGWPEYEWRWKRKRARPRIFPQPLWDGSNSKVRQFWSGANRAWATPFSSSATCRWSKPVAAMCWSNVPTNSWPCSSPVPASTRSSPRHPAGTPQVPPFDVQVPLMSLPGIFGTRLHNIPAQIPYLTPRKKPSTMAKWRQEFAKRPSESSASASSGKATPNTAGTATAPLLWNISSLGSDSRRAAL